MGKETITREIISHGFEKKLISIKSEFFGCCGICCNIGEYAFYFIGCEDENLSEKEYWNSYTLDETINMIYDILKNERSAVDNGIYEDEYNYYAAVLTAS